MAETQTRRRPSSDAASSSDSSSSNSSRGVNSRPLNTNSAPLANLPSAYLQNSANTSPTPTLSESTPANFRDVSSESDNLVTTSEPSSADSETESATTNANEEPQTTEENTDPSTEEEQSAGAEEEGEEDSEANASAETTPATEGEGANSEEADAPTGDVVLSNEVSSSSESSSASEEQQLPDIPILLIPRMNNIRAPHIPSPPKPAIERRDEIVQKTGSPPELHHAQIRQAVQRVAQVARNSSRQLQWRINLLAKDTKLSFFAIADEISHHVRSAIGTISGSIASARNSIRSTVTSIEQHFEDNEALTGQALRDSQENRSREVRDTLLENNTELQNAHTELQGEFSNYLNPAKENMRKIGTDGVVTPVPGPPGGGAAAAGNTPAPPGNTSGNGAQAGAAQKNMAAVQEDISARYGTLNGSDIGKYVKHSAQPVVTRMYDGTQRRLTATFNRQAESLESYRVSFSTNALQLVTPAVRSTETDSPNRDGQSEETHTAQVEEVREGKDYNLGQIRSKRSDAMGFLDKLSRDLIKGLRKMEKKAVKTFIHQGKMQERMLQNTAAPLMKSYPELINRVDNMLPDGKFLDSRKYLPSIIAARNSAQQLPDQQMKPLHERTQLGLAQAEEGKKKQIESIGKSVSKGVQSVNDVTIKTCFDMDSFAFQATGVMREGGWDNIRGAQDYALRIANDLLGTKGQADGQLNNLLRNYVGNFNQNIAQAGNSYFSAVDSFHGSIFGPESGVFKVISQENATKLSEKSSILHQNLTHADPDVVVGLVATNIVTAGATTGATVAYLVYSDADQGDVLQALGSLDWPGQAALEEYFNTRTSYGNLYTRIVESLDEDDASAALNMLSSNAEDRAKGRLDAAEASLSWTDFGISDEARQDLLAGMSAEERQAADPTQMTRIGEEINSSWTLTDTEVRMETGYLNGNLDEVLAARMEQNMRTARNDGNSNIQTATQNIDQLARAELGRTQSMSYMQPQEIQGLIDDSMREFAAHRPGESRGADDIDLTEARRTFVDYATADRIIYHGGEAPPTPIPVDQFVQDYVEEVVMNGFYVEREVEGSDETVWENNQEAQARAQAYQVHRAETEYGDPSNDNVTQFNSAFRNPQLNRLEQQVAVERARAQREGRPPNQELLDQLSRARGAHEAQMDRVARRLGMTDDDKENSGSATEWLAQRATQAFAGEDAVPVGQERQTEPGMARFTTEVIRGGRASVAAGVHVAGDGWGTNEDLLRTVYAGRTRAEIQAAEDEWEERYDQDLNEYLGIKEREWDALDYAVLAISPAAGLGLLAYRGGETSGDLAMELEILSRGEPETDQDRIEIALLRAEQQQGRGTGLLGQLTMSGTAENQDMNARRQDLARMLLQQAIAAQGPNPPADQELPGVNGVFLPDGRINPVVAGLAFGSPAGASSDSALNQFLGNRDGLMQGMHELQLAGTRYQSEQERQESLMLAGITVLAIAATIILMAFGVGFVLAGMLVALGSGILTMAVKQGMRGERYGWEEAATDAAMTAIEVAAAGAGGALAGGFGNAGKLGSVVSAFNKLGPVAGPMAREALVGAVSSAAQVALQDGTYDHGVGKAFERIMGGGLKGAAIGAASAGISELATNKLGGGLARGLDGADVGAIANSGRNMGSNARLMLTEVVSEGLGSVAGDGVAILIEISKGEFRGGLDDALRRMGEGALREMVSAAGRTAATNVNKRRYNDLMDQARTKENLTDSDLRALRMAGAAAGEPFEGLDNVRARVVEGQRILNTLPAEIRDHVRGLDVDNLRTLADMLEGVALGSSTGDRQKLLQDISEKAPHIDMVELTRQLESANAQRQAALDKEHDAAALAQQQRANDQLVSGLSPDLADRFRSQPIAGMDKLAETDIDLAADMIRNGNFDQGRADALLRSARANDPDLDGFAFLKGLHAAVETSRLAKQAQLEISAKQRAFVTGHVPEEAKMIFAGLPDDGIAKVKQALNDPDGPSRQAQDALYRMAKEIDPDLSQDQFRSFLDSASASVKQEQAVQRQTRRDERQQQRMVNVPEHLRGDLSVLPDAALIELRIRQMEGDISPAEKQRLIDIALKEDPSLNIDTFSKALDDAVATQPQRQPDAAEETVLRQELLAAVPADQRGLVEDVPIIVMRGEAFESLTRSESGNAVTLIIHGRPVVVMREGASPGVLREEGVHVLQSKDPQWAERMGALDESHLRNWDELSLEQQLALYRNKVELEIDAQHRVIDSLEADIARANSEQEAQRLQQQLQQAMASLNNLSKRHAEVNSVDAIDISHIKAGFSERPQWLDQPARLFNKGNTSKGDADDEVSSVDPTRRNNEDEEASRVGRVEDESTSSIRDVETTLHVVQKPIADVHQRFLDDIDATGAVAKEMRKKISAMDEQILRDIDTVASDGGTARSLLRMAVDDTTATRNFLDDIGTLAESVRETAVNKLLIDKSSAETMAHDLRDLSDVLGDSTAANQLMLDIVNSPDRGKRIDELNADLRQLRDVVGVEKLNDLLSLTADASLSRRLIDQAVGSGNPNAHIDALKLILTSIPEADIPRVLGNLSRDLKDAQVKLVTIAKIAALDLDSDTKFALIDGVISHLNDVDSVVSRVKTMVAINTLIDAAKQMHLDPADMGRILTGMLSKSDDARNRFQFLESTAVLFRELGDVADTVDGKKILDHVQQALTDSAPLSQEAARNLEADIRSAAKLLAESSDKNGLLKLFVETLRTKQSLTGGDPTEMKIQEAISKWPKFVSENPDFAKTLLAATTELSIREHAVLAEIVPWFKELARIRGISDEQGQINLLRQMLEAEMGSDLSSNSYGKLKDLSSTMRNTVVDESLSTEVPSVREYLKAQGVSEEQLQKHLLDTAEEFKQAYLDGRDPVAMHVEALIRQEQRVKTMLEIAERIGASDAGLKQKLTEVRGEMAFTIEMLTNPEFADCRPVAGFKVGTGFDQVWERVGADGRITEIIIGEAKGPGATLGNSLKGEQMSPEWIMNTATELINQGGAAKTLGEKILQAMVDGEPPIRGIVVTAGEDGADAKVDDRGHFDYGDDLINQLK